MSFVADNILRTNSPDALAHGYVRPDSQVQAEIEDKVNQFKGTLAPAVTPAKGLAGLEQRKANILAEDDQNSAVDNERKRLYNSSFGLYGDRLLGGAYSTLSMTRGFA